MKLKQIEAFLMIIERGSFSAAAEALFITQPTISIRINQLEEELGKPLFERKEGQKVILTKYGLEIKPYFSEAMKLIDIGTSLLQEDQDKQRQKMVISCPNHMGVEILPELLKVLYTRYPHIEFDVKINPTKKILDDFQQGIVDVGLCYLQEKKKFKDLTMLQIAKEEILLVCAPNHRLAQTKLISVTDLKEERLILYNRDILASRVVEEYLQREGLSEFKTTEVSNLGWVKMMVRKEIGIAFLQKAIVQDELLTNKLVNLPIEKPLSQIPIYLVFKNNIENEIKQTLIETTKDMFMEI